MTASQCLDYGIQLTMRGEFQQAVVAFCRAIQLDPQYSRAYNNLGLVLQRMNKLSEAEVFLRRAIDLDPHDSYSYNNLGLVFLDTHRLADAEACLRQAIELNPHCPEVYNNLGLVLEEAVRLDEAEKLYRHAIALNSRYTEAYYNLGNCYKTMKRLAEAESCLKQAIRLQPDYADAAFSLATLYLLQGKYELGWQSYDMLRLKQSTKRAAGIRCWQGENLTESKILLFYEQGFGDTIQYVRYADKIAKLASGIVLWVQKPLAGLIAASYPALTVYAGENVPPGHYDFACSLPSLPVILNTSATSIPQTVPYIKPDCGLVANWRRRLDGICGGLLARGGIVWAGNPQHHNDRNRSIPFSLFSSLLSVKTINWINLQVGSHASDLTTTNDAVIDFSPDLVDFSQTAGLIANLDLVITVDSAVAHLSGAMGKKTWLLVPFAPDWRWQLEREDSSWYPTLRLFRQDKPGDWTEVIARVKTALKRVES
ncbi:MAG: tetratricopeptide repeat-containing glycosyltransferase family protein [Veillonellales bacterium]